MLTRKERRTAWRKANAGVKVADKRQANFITLTLENQEKRANKRKTPWQSQALEPVRQQPWIYQVGDTRWLARAMMADPDLLTKATSK